MAKRKKTKTDFNFRGASQLSSPVEFEFPLVATSTQTGEQQVIKIDENWIVNQMVSCWYIHKSSRNNLEQKWLRSFDAYNLRPIVPAPGQKWQSDVNLPDIHKYIEVGVNMFRKAVVQGGTFFSISPEIPEFDDIAPGLTELVLKYLQSSNFLDSFEASLKYGFFTGTLGVLPEWKHRVLSVDGQMIGTAGLEFRSCDPFDTILDEYGRFVLEREWVPRENIVQLMQLGEYAQADVKWMPQLDNITEELRQKHYYDYSYKEDMGELLHYTGTIFDGDKFYPNVDIVVLNRERVIRVKPIKNWLNRPLYCLTQFYKILKGQYGMGLVDVVASLFQEYTIAYRMMIDNLLLAMGLIAELNSSGIDATLVEKIKKDGILPFHLIEKDTEADVVTVKPIHQFNPNALPVVQKLKMDMDAATPSLDEVGMGKPTSKGRPTAKEIMAKMNRSGEILGSIAERVDSDILAKCVLFAIILILENESPERLQLMLKKEMCDKIEAMGRQKIVELLITRAGIKVDTISLMLQKREIIEKLVQFLQIASELPNKDKINYDWIMQQFAILLGFSPSDVFVQKTEEQKQKEEAAQEVISDFVIKALFADDKQKTKFLEKIGETLSEKVAALTDLSRITEIIKGAIAGQNR